MMTVLATACGVVFGISVALLCERAADKIAGGKRNGQG